VELLTEFNFEQAQQFASEIEQYNSDRKDLDKQITKESIPSDRRKQRTRAVHLCRISRELATVIGIVASRLIETYYRPTLVFTKKVVINMQPQRAPSKDLMCNALEACSNHLEQFGGHMYAAGMTIKPENVVFKEAFENKCKTQ
jgi:single-stranded-DNA-specific exonuclease